MGEHGTWRLLISLGIGGAAAAIATVVGVAVRSPKVPLAAGLSAAITAYVIDWYTERQQHGD